MKRKDMIEFFKSIYPSTINFTPKRLGRNKRVPGFGFLVLRSEKEAQDALKCEKFLYRNRELKAEPYLTEEDLKTQKDGFEKKKVYVGKIPRRMNTKELKKAMEEAFGEIQKAYIIINSSYKRKHRRGFGYVIFNTEASAKKAIEAKYLEIASFKTVLALERPNEKNQEKDENQKNLKKSNKNQNSTFIKKLTAPS